MSWLDKMSKAVEYPKQSEKRKSKRSSVIRRSSQTVTDIQSTAEMIGELSYIKDPKEIAKKAETVLLHNRNPETRHFAYNFLEKALYRLRAEPGRLEKFEEVCLQHDSEIQSMLPGLRAHDGHLPVIPMYKQMAIYKEKAGEYEGAIEWCNRGLATYRNDGIKNQEEDLRKRITRLETKSK